MAGLPTSWATGTPVVGQRESYVPGSCVVAGLARERARPSERDRQASAKPFHCCMNEDHARPRPRTGVSSCRTVEAD